MTLPDRWHRRFLDLAAHVAQWSRDPSTQVGAVIVRPDRTIVSVGFNGFPRGVRDLPERYADRPTKYAFVVHAEANALLTAREPLAGYTLYSTLMTCNECAKLIIQAGISQVVAPAPCEGREQPVAMQMYEEAGVTVTLLPAGRCRQCLPNGDCARGCEPGTDQLCPLHIHEKAAEIRERGGGIRYGRGVV